MSPFLGAPVRVLSFALGVATLGLLSASPRAEATPEPKILGDLKGGAADLYAEIIPSIIQVFNGGGGSGYVIDKGGYAITNRHVTGVEPFFEITFNDGVDDAVRWRGERIGSDPAIDFSLLKIEAPEERLHPIKLADTSLLEVGDTCVTVGSPGGQRGQTNTSDRRDGWLDYFNFNVGVLTEIIPMDRCGIVFGDIIGHAQRADLYQLDYGTAVTYLYHVDSAINRGNSGGPSITARGEAMGTNTWGYFDGGANFENMGMSVPVNLLTRSARDILQYGRVRRPWLGIALHDPKPTRQAMRDADRDLSDVAGAPIVPEPDELRIYLVNKYSPAAEYLKEGDVILSVDGVQYKNIFDIYTYILDHKFVGDPITLHVERGGIGLPPITIDLAEKQNRFSDEHISMSGGPGGVRAAGRRGIGAGVVSVTY